MRLNFLIFPLVLLWTGNGSLFGKGLNTLAPAQENASQDDEGWGEEDDPENDGEESGEKSKPIPPSELSLYLSNRLFLSTSFGLSSLKKGSVSWRSSGLGELAVGFDPQTPIAGMPVIITGRYVPMDVAPNFEKNGRSEEYKGVVEFWLVGGELWIPVQEGMTAVAGAELGLGFVHLIDQIELPDEEQPEDIAMGFLIGGGADWKVLEKLMVGPRLKVGLGTFTQIQLSAHLTFAF